MSGNKVEHIKDAAPILGKYFDVLAIRTFPSLVNKEDDYSEMYIHQFIKYAGVPVISCINVCNNRVFIVYIC